MAVILFKDFLGGAQGLRINVQMPSDAPFRGACGTGDWEEGPCLKTPTPFCLHQEL